VAEVEAVARDLANAAAILAELEGLARRRLGAGAVGQLKEGLRDLLDLEP
jgi:hypothetical protein